MRGGVVAILLCAVLCDASSEEVTTTGSASCPLGWFEFSGSCYYLINTELDWFGAEKYCSLFDPTAYRVHLVAIESPEEMGFVKEYARVLGVAGRGFWTSGNIIDRRAGWVWSQINQPFGYSNWAAGEPNGSGLCVQLWAERDYAWDDSDCESLFSLGTGAICEVSLENAANVITL